MWTIRFLAAVATVVSSGMVTAAPTVDVIFVRPEAYADALPNWPSTAREREEVLQELRRHIVALASRQLRGDDRLTVEILDLRLAGDPQGRSVGGRGVRVIRDRPLPSIHLRYTIARAGRDETAGEARLTDLASMRRDECSDGPALCHEKRLLRQWFDGLVAPH